MYEKYLETISHMQDIENADIELTNSILEKLPGDKGVLISFQELSYITVLDVKYKYGHAIDRSGNVLDLKGLNIGATFDIELSAKKVYVYYPNLSNVEETIGNTGYSELGVGTSFAGAGTGVNNYTSEGYYVQINGGLSKSGLPSLGVDGLPINLTPIGVEFIWEDK